MCVYWIYGLNGKFEQEILITPYWAIIYSSFDVKFKSKENVNEWVWCTSVTGGIQYVNLMKTCMSLTKFVISLTFYGYSIRYFVGVEYYYITTPKDTQKLMMVCLLFNCLILWSLLCLEIYMAHIYIHGNMIFWCFNWRLINEVLKF